MDYEKEVHSPATFTVAVDNDPPSYPATPTEAHIITTVLHVPTNPSTPIPNIHPFSAFYTHSPTSSTFPASNYALASNLEAGAASLPTSPRLSPEKHLASASTLAITITPSKECSQWPGMRTRGEEMARGKLRCVYAPLRGLTAQQRLCIKILIAVFIIGVAVAVGVGISKAVGRGVWKADEKGASS